MTAPSDGGPVVDRPLKGIAFMIGSVTCIAVVDALAKWLIAAFPLLEVIAIRSAFVVAFALALAVRPGGVAALAIRRPWAHLLRIGLSVASILCFYEALRTLPLATASILSFSSPLFMIVLSSLLLGERAGAHRWGAVAVGFLGVVLIAQPGGEVVDTRAAMLAVAAGLTYAASTVAVRWMARTESDLSIVVYNNTGILLLSAAALPWVWTPPAATDMALLALMGAAVILWQMLMVKAFRHAPVATLAPFHYSEIVVVTLIGFVVWGELPGLQVWTGAAIIVGAGLYVMLLEARTK